MRQYKNDAHGGVRTISTDDGGLSTNERQRLKELERENRELRRSNDLLRQASAYFAQAELDRHWKNVMNASHSLNAGRYVANWVSVVSAPSGRS